MKHSHLYSVLAAGAFALGLLFAGITFGGSAVAFAACDSNCSVGGLGTGDGF